MAALLVGRKSLTPCPLLQIVAEEVSGTNDYVQLTFRAHKLDNKVGSPECRIHTPLESRRQRTRQIPGSQADSPLSVTPSPPSSQTHELFPRISRICSASLTLSWRSTRPMETRVTSWSGGLRWVHRAIGWRWADFGKETYTGSDKILVVSKVVKNNLNPSWEPFRLSLHSLCSCDIHRPLKVKPPWSTQSAVGDLPQDTANLLPLPPVISTCMSLLHK